jgi:hypothetical protein
LAVSVSLQGALPRHAIGDEGTSLDTGLISDSGGVVGFIKSIPSNLYDAGAFAAHMVWEYNPIMLSFKGLKYLIGKAGDLLCWFGIDYFCSPPAEERDEGAGPPDCPDNIGAPGGGNCCNISCGPGPTADELNHFSGDIANAEVAASKEIGQARKLLGLDNQVAPGDDGLAANGEAATAGGVASNAPTANLAGGGSNLGGALPGGPSARGGGSGGGGGGSGGLGSDFGKLSTAPSAGSGSGAADATSGPSGSSGDGTYTSGAGAGAATAGNGFGYNRGSGMGGDGAGGTSEQVEFGDAGATGDVAVIGEDPEDYFTRVGIDDNLFKIVERRYGKKASGWVQDDLKQKP